MSWWPASPAFRKSLAPVEMSGVVNFLRKSLKRSSNAVRRVGKATRRTLKRGTNAVGLTKRRRSAHRRRSHRSRRAGRR